MELSRFESFSKFQINNFLTDIEIILINGTIKAHKLILAASSEFFKVLLNNDVYKEVSTGIINLPSVDFDVFNYIFDHIYLRNSEIILHKDLSFYIDVIQASDYLQMLDIIDLLDDKLSISFSFFEFFKEDYQRIFSLPMKKTKRKILDNITEMINSKNYSELIDLSPSVLLKIFEININNNNNNINYFTINENLLWDFFKVYFEKINNNNHYNTLKQKQELVDFIRPGLLNNNNLESFYLLLNKNNFLWRNQSEKRVKIILNDLLLLPSNDKIREMNFIETDNNESICKTRSNPYLIVIGSDSMVNRTLKISKISLIFSPFQYENSLNFDNKISLENSRRFQSFDNHLLLSSEYWDFNTNLGIVFSLVNFDHFVIPRWQQRLVDRELDDFSKLWGFSVALVGVELFLFGGCFFTHSSITVPSTKILKFNFIENEWTICRGVELKTCCWSSSTVKDKRKSRGKIVYLSGGRSPQKYLKSFYAIDLETCSIIDYPNLPFSVSGHTMEMVTTGEAVNDNNVIAVFGGTWDNCVRNEILLFDLSTSLWRVVTLAEIPTSRHIDYCFHQHTTDKLVVSNHTLLLYDLRIDCAGKTKIYSHQIDMKNNENSENYSLIETDSKCGFPSNIIFGMSMKSSDQTSITIKQSIFEDFPDVDNLQ